MLLPFLDRSADRRPFTGQRMVYSGAFILIATGVAVMTGIGFTDRPRLDAPAPAPAEIESTAREVWDSVCFACHKLNDEGGTAGPDLTKVGARRDYDSIRLIIEDPLNMYDESVMPPFDKRLTPEQISALAAYLASLR
jgi:mono/diheme cytochrome c family protein